MPCWLIKSEPESYSIQDLAAAPNQTTCWDGVRNYQARNYLRAMQLGDKVLFYHSSANPPAVVGAAVVVKTAYPDHTAWDPKNDHYDPKASPQNPIWAMVDVQLVEIFPQPVPIATLRATPSLAGLELLRPGSRLSVHPVSEAHFQIIESLGRGATTVPAAPRPARKRKPARKPRSADTRTIAKSGRQRGKHRRRERP